MYEMYRLLAIAKYEERYVIPKAHVEQAHELEELGCSLDFDGGPYEQPDRSARPVGGQPRSPSRPSRRSGSGRPPTCRRPGSNCSGRVNLLNWDGKGSTRAACSRTNSRRAEPSGGGREAEVQRRGATGRLRRRRRSASAIRTRCRSTAADLLRPPLAERRRRHAEGTFASSSTGWRARRRSGTICRADYVELSTSPASTRLYLSYWTDGDTRRRGQVLAEVKQRYRRSGFLVNPRGELPDYLPVVLEYAAMVGPEDGLDLLQGYRASLELIRLSLAERSAPYAGVRRGGLRDPARCLAGRPAGRAWRMAAAGPPPRRSGRSVEPGCRLRTASPAPGIVEQCEIAMNVLLWGVLPYIVLAILDRRHRSGAIATTSSAGPPAPPSCMSRGCCGSAPRCSTSASSSSSSATSSVC